MSNFKSYDHTIEIELEDFFIKELDIVLPIVEVSVHASQSRDYYSDFHCYQYHSEWDIEAISWDQTLFPELNDQIEKLLWESKALEEMAQREYTETVEDY